MYVKARLTFRNITSFYLLEHVLLFLVAPQIFVPVLLFTLQSILLSTFKYMGEKKTFLAFNTPLCSHRTLSQEYFFFDESRRKEQSFSENRYCFPHQPAPWVAVTQGLGPCIESPLFCKRERAQACEFSQI